MRDLVMPPQERQQKKPSAGAGMTTPIASPAGLRRVREPSVKGRPSPESAAQMQRAPASKKGRSASTYCRVRDSAHVDGHALAFDSAAAPNPSSAHSNACPCLCVARCRRWRGRRRRDGWRRGGARSGQRGGRRLGRRAERRGGRRRHRQRGRQQSRHEAYQARGHGLARPSSSSVNCPRSRVSWADVTRSPQRTPATHVYFVVSFAYILHEVTLDNSRCTKDYAAPRTRALVPSKSAGANAQLSS